jgi:L-idonate 5-dehydrogenase
MDALVIHSPGDLRVENYPTAALERAQLRVRVRAGGICGSDLHYFQHGGFGTVRIQEPMVLGHEVAGVIEELGPDTNSFTVGQRIAISPSRPCGVCRFCQQGLQNHCLDMRYYGSAMRTPHVQGAFRQEIVVETYQAHLLADSLSDNEGAMAEPLSVALHAVRRAGPLLGQRVLVTGCGPIGALLVIAARRAGAAHIVVTDVAPYPLRKALQVGADEAINVVEEADRLARYNADKGQFDVLFEASGNERALRGAFDAVRPRGVIVQVGPDQHHRRQGVRFTWRVPLPRRIRRGGGTPQQRAGGRQAADLGDASLSRCRARIQAGGGPVASDEGVVEFRLTIPGGASRSGRKPRPLLIFLRKPFANHAPRLHPRSITTDIDPARGMG